VVLGLLGLLGLLMARTAQAHDTLVFQANPNIQINSMFRSTPESLVLQGMINVRLRPQTMEIELTMADSPAYRLLDHDPFAEEQAATAKSSTPNDPAEAQAHFARDQAALTQRAASLLAVSSHGEPLKLTSTVVSFTSALEVVFHFTYPRPAGGPWRLELTYAAQIPPGQCDLVTVYDQANLELATATLDAKNPSWEINLPAPATPAATASASPPPPERQREIVAGIAVVLALAALAAGWKLIRRP